MKEKVRLTHDILSDTNELEKLIRQSKPVIEFGEDLSEFKENAPITQPTALFFYQIAINSEKCVFLKEKKLTSQPIFKPTQFKSGFIGENLTLQEYSSLDEDKKIHLQSTLLEKNDKWLSKKFQELNAAWVTVVDGEIETFSSDIDKYPQRDDVLGICKKRGKFPFIFVNNLFLAIEEASSSIWSKTDYPDDYYPTVNIQINSSNSSFKLTADFDTGAPETYMDLSRLISERLVDRPSYEEVPQRGMHLGKPYWYYVKDLSVVVVSEQGKIKREKSFPVICVQEWGKSPFVCINPNRAALVGRGLFLKIKPSVLLNFSAQKTEIY